MSKYHINARDLQDLPWTMGTSVVYLGCPAFPLSSCSFSLFRSPAKINGAYQIMPMHNYRERDIEMKAWEKYGGPERFEEMYAFSSLNSAWILLTS